MADHGSHHDSYHEPGTDPSEPKILSSNYDGIREYDNPMPAWWTSLFWASILFSVPYFIFYHMGVGPTLNDDYEAEVGAFAAAQAETLGDIKPDAATILTLVDDPKWKLGASVMFRSNCQTCHGPEGGGVTGPNLADDAFINVKTPEDIFRIIRDGVVAKGMPAWGERFSEPQLILLASYVASLRGTTPSTAKAAEGSPIPPWPEVAAPAPTTEAAADAPASAPSGS